MRTPRLLPLLVLALLFAATLHAQVIRDISIAGAESVDQAEIISHLQSQVGDQIDMDKIRADQNTILNYGIFSPDIRVLTEDRAQGDGVRLIFTVTENPVVSTIDIAGNVSEPTERIEDMIDQQVGERLSHMAARDAETSITEYYRRRGHARVNVRVRTLPQVDGTVAMSVIIDEGEIITVGEINFVGNDSFSGWRLRQQMVTQESGIFGENHFADTVFEEDLYQVQQFLFDHGYLDASVTRGEMDFDEEERTINPTVEIVEGPRYRFDGITLRGNTLFTDLEIEQVFERLHGEWFSREKLSKCIETLQAMYGDEGHINAVIEPRFRPEPTEGVVHIVLAVQEGPRVFVGDIYVQRTETTAGLEPPVSSLISRVAERISPPINDDTVRRFVDLQEGEVYRHYQEVRTVERLRRLNIFRNVDIQRRASSDPTVENAVISLDQQSTGFVTVGVGIGDDSGLFGFVRLQENNFQGQADTIAASVQLGTRSLDFDVTYFNRFIDDTDLSLRLSAYDRSRRRREYDEDRTGGYAELGQPISEYVTLFYQIRGEYVRFDPDGNVSNATRRAMDSYWLSLARVALEEDRRDEADWPTRGWLRNVSLEAGWAQDWLVRIYGQLEYYHRIWRDVIFAWNLEGGVIPRDLDDIAFGERFFLGGSRDLRGFAFRGAGPTDSVNNDLFVGGSTKILSQFEIRFPIYERLRGLVFVDAGTLGTDPFDMEAPRASTGFGLRFALPGFGHLALDIAVPLVKQSGDDTQVLHFTFVTGF